MQGHPHSHDPPGEYEVPMPCAMCVGQRFQCTRCHLEQQITRGSESDFGAIRNRYLSSDPQQPVPALPFYDPLLLTSQSALPDITVGVSTQSHPTLMSPSAAFETSIFQQVPFRSHHVVPVAEPRLQGVTVSLWTSVPIDGLLMSELLASYFQQGYLLSMPFQKDLFLEDLVSDKKKPPGYEIKYCSSLLVNAILATAANTYTGGHLAANGFRLASLTEAFLTQAMQLWESEALIEPRLTTIQAAQILSLHHASDFRNDIGFTFLSHAVTMAVRMELFTTSHDEWTATGMACKFTSWSLFCWQSTYCFNNLIPPLVSDPPIATLPEYAYVAELTGELRLGNPEIEPTTPLGLGRTFRAIAMLDVILNDINQTESLRGTGDSKTSTLAKQQVLTLCARLRSWFNSLPGEIQDSKGEMSHYLRVHMAYSHAQCVLLEPWVQGGQPSLAENKDTHILYKSGLEAQIRMAELVETLNLKHSEIGSDPLQCVHPFLLGILPGGRSSQVATQ